MTVRNAASMGNYGASWEAAGYCGQGNVAGLVGSLRGRPAIVAGGAAGVFAEVSDATTKLADPVIFASNDVGMFLPRVDHWVSLHTDNLGAWKAVRWLHARDKEDMKMHAPDSRPYVDYVWQGLTPMLCLSGYFAMQIAWIMGCAPIVLCGCPGMPTPRFFEAMPRADFGYGLGDAGSDSGVREQIEQEMRRVPDFKLAVRSMTPGSWTQQVFAGV
jgi:hypothetical protein